MALAAPAMAAAPTTRLASCRTGSCLVVSGHRDRAGVIVLINGHAVAVEGERNWQARLPLDTVRAWSEPLARSISVATYDPQARSGTTSDADLPIGLLGHVELSTLVVAVK
ncbi:MAG: hypothetical protein KGM17_00275 [Sphingomonadales bacterium]|nr:hypothetical protein [Sphingomonadales bacterium]